MEVNTKGPMRVAIAWRPWGTMASTGSSRLATVSLSHDRPDRPQSIDLDQKRTGGEAFDPVQCHGRIGCRRQFRRDLLDGLVSRTSRR